ncbi:hypothetical protein [Nonomuraea salmonea]|uniref:hypothetical protein n=1 Tax=Nonomuraea salmonea TaxID=46181 RepID=UPI002FEC8388
MLVDGLERGRDRPHLGGPAVGERFVLGRAAWDEQDARQHDRAAREVHVPRRPSAECLRGLILILHARAPVRERHGRRDGDGHGGVRQQGPARVLGHDQVDAGQRGGGHGRQPQGARNIHREERHAPRRQ